MNKTRPIPEVVDEQKETYTRGCGWIKRDLWQRLSTLGIGLFLFIHNLWYRSRFIHPQPLSQFLFYSSATPGIGSILFFQETHTRGCWWKKEAYSRGCGWMERDIWQRLQMNKKRTIPEVVDELKETHNRGCLFIHSLWYRCLFIHPQLLS
jgi:hypothetical protein